MNIENIKFVKEFVKVSTDCFKKGWNERNGGNLTYRLSEEDVKDIQPWIKDSEKRTYPLGVTLKDLANEYFFVSGSGKFFRNVCLDLQGNCGLIQLDNQGENYTILWGLVDDGKPTSELPSHLMCHSVKKRTTNNKNRVILHSHTTNTVALTFVLPLTSEAFTKEIWEMITECPMIFPTGIGVVEWMVPGSVAIGERTRDMMEKHDVVVWAHHGMFVCGDTLDLAFGLMDTVEKAAEILVKVRSMGGKKQTITREHFEAIGNEFDIDIDLSLLK